MNLSKLSSTIIEICFYLLFFLVPLIWLPVTSELFEFNKMILVYFLTLLVSGSWVIKSLCDKKFELVRTPLDIPILLFLLANILSTIFSLDQQTSLFGYYGRWHGGLLSTISYIILYYALVTHFNRKQIYYFLASLLTSGLIVSIYAILQHPNPLFRETLDGKTVLHGIDYSYWSVDVENRVFSTFGQPNWLAAFLAMLLFPLLSLLFILRKFWQQVWIFAAITFYFLAFTFAYSRAGLVGLALGATTFVVLFPLYKPTLLERIKMKIPLLDFSQTLIKIKLFLIPISAILVMVFTVNQFFGNALTLRGGLQTSSQTTTIDSSSKQPVSRPPTQLESSGQETAKIRTIVWTGAIDIFKHYPIFGSGVETFGYSYYLFRPIQHNYTSEWDYLYNKAHNEYLNTLATTGALGFLSLVFLIILFEALAIRMIVKNSFSATRLLSLGLLAGFNANLAANFFGFSVVTTGLLFFALPAMFFTINDQFRKSFVIDFRKNLKVLNQKPFNQIAIFASLLLALFAILYTLGMWTADHLYNRSLSENTYQKAIADLRLAHRLQPFEPKYSAELATNLSALAEATLVDKDSQSPTKNYLDEARRTIDQVTNQYPNNTSLWLNRRTVDFNLSKVDTSQNLNLLKTAGKLRDLAPTEASIQYDVALVYLFLEEDDEAIKQLEKVVNLKTDYRDAVLLLGKTYVRVGQADKAINTFEDWLKTHPGDSEVQQLLSEIKSA